MALIIFRVQDGNARPIGGALLSSVGGPGPWQGMTNACGDFFAELGAGAYTITISKVGYVTRTMPANLADPGIITIGLESGVPPLTVDLRKWRGAFVIPNAIPGIAYGDGQRIWTPAYGAYNDATRTQIRTEFARRNYTHFVYNCAGLPYHTDYPELQDDPERVRRDLTELRSGGIAPVVVATDDRQPDRVLNSFRANAALIPICFPCWEQNGPLNNDTQRQRDLIVAVREAAPNANCYIHFTAGHGSIGFPERDQWRWCAEQGVFGLLSQDNGYDRNMATGDPAGTAAGLADTASRLATLGLLNVAFEQTTYPTYNHTAGWDDEVKQKAYGDYLMQHAAGIAGFCDGGSA